MDAAQQRHEEQRQRFYNYRATPSQPEPVYGGTYSTDYPLRNNHYYQNGLTTPYPVAGIETAHLKDMWGGDHPSSRQNLGASADGYRTYDEEQRDVEARAATPQSYRSDLTEYHPRYKGDKEPAIVNISSKPTKDEILKTRIRYFRCTSRALGLVVSILIFVPMLLTVIKYLETRRIERVAGPSNTGRGPWATKSVVWPTYAYFGAATVTMLLSIAMMLSYFTHDFRVSFKNAKQANRWAIATATSSGVTTAIWVVSVIVYRAEKKDNDLWGWACGEPAAAIQDVFKQDLNFNFYCRAQSWSWYAGFAQAACAAVTCVGLWYVYERHEKRKEAEADQARLLPKS